MPVWNLQLSSFCNYVAMTVMHRTSDFKVEGSSPLSVTIFQIPLALLFFSVSFLVIISFMRFYSNDKFRSNNNSNNGNLHGHCKFLQCESLLPSGLTALGLYLFVVCL